MKKMTALFLSLVMLITAGCAASEKEEEPAGSQTGSATEEITGAAVQSGDILVLFTGDVHSAVDRNFGYVGLKAVMDTAEAAGDQVLLVDSGDSLQGEALATLSRGEANMRLMNALGYDAAIPGNHEFDYGAERFLELAEMAQFPYVSCNLNREGELLFDPYVILEAGGKKIAFVGVTTPLTLTTSTPKYFQDEQGNYIYGFLQDETGETLAGAVQAAVNDARAEGAQYVIVIGHMGNADAFRPWTYADIIGHTEGIDAFIDGHSHDSDRVVMKNRNGQDVIRQACGTKMEGIGWLRISGRDGSMDAGLYTWKNSVSAPELFGIENAMTAHVKDAFSGLDSMLSEVVAKSTVDLTINDPSAVTEEGAPVRIIRRAETNLGDLCADAFRDQSGADIAVINGGGIRVSIDRGEMTGEDIMSVFPFGNMLTVVKASGQQILDALEWGSSAVPGENGGFLQVSGLTYEIHTYLDSTCTHDENGMFTGITGERRVKNVTVNGEPLDPGKMYTVASLDYILLNHGNGYTMFDGCEVLQDAVRLDNQVLIDYIRDTLGGEIGADYADPYGEGRITAVGEAR